MRIVPPPDARNPVTVTVYPARRWCIAVLPPVLSLPPVHFRAAGGGLP